MQQQTQHTLRTIAHENNSNVSNLFAQLIQLKTVQNEVARLLNKLDDITHKGWHKDHGMYVYFTNPRYSTFN